MDTIKNRGERLTLGDHLEHAFLPGQQGLAPLQGRLGLLAVLDVGRRARPVHEVSPLVAHRHRTQEAPAIHAIARSRTRCLRLNTRGLPSDRHKGKKAYIRGPSWHPSGPLISGDALDAGRAGTRRRLRSPPVAVSHHHGVLIPPLAAATAARGTGAPHAGSTPDPSTRLPSPAYRAATAWLNPCRKMFQRCWSAMLFGCTRV